ncbi:MAG: hypothetical protein KF713_05950 [Turneriella sp.]|nr:hypothetical protein [Turneriella sp.]
MNPQYKDNMLGILPLLERGRALSVQQVISLGTAMLTERTVQRYLKEFREVYGLDLGGARRGELALPAVGYRDGLSRFLKAYFSERRYPPVHGEVSEKLISSAIEGHNRPAQVICEILKAMRESRRLNFAYRPQHPETRRKVNAKKVRLSSRFVEKGYIAVSMIPCGFSFGGELMLIVGETILPDSQRVQRQYAVRGMLNPQSGSVENVQLEFDFSEIYADSVYTWIGGQRYNLTIEDARFDEAPRIYQIRANGEEEALQFAGAALGRLRIVNPPSALVAKAEELGLDAARIFRFTA